MTDKARVRGGAPSIPASSVFTDGTTITGNGTSADPLSSAATRTVTLTVTDVDTDYPIGTPFSPNFHGTADVNGLVVPSKGASTFGPSDDPLRAQMNCIGLATEAALQGEEVTIQYDGPLELTTAQWDALTSDSGGLVQGDIYYVSSTSSGKLVKVPPSAGGSWIVQIGIAISSTVMLIGRSLPTQN